MEEDRSGLEREFSIALRRLRNSQTATDIKTQRTRRWGNRKCPWELALDGLVALDAQQVALDGLDVQDALDGMNTLYGLNALDAHQEALDGLDAQDAAADSGWSAVDSAFPFEGKEPPILPIPCIYKCLL